MTRAKLPLRPKHVWSIRTKLQMADRKRDLALFNLAIDSKLRGCDVVALEVEDIAPHGYAVERDGPPEQGRPVRFEITEQSGKRLTITFVWRIEEAGENFFLPRGANLIRASRLDNMRGSSPTGYAASGSICVCSVRIHCAGPRPR